MHPSRKKVIHLVAAARPNFMKIAPLYHALNKLDWAEAVIIHTGQHYDVNMSAAFFQDLRLPAPHIHLGIGSGTHAEQTAGVMIAYEKLLMKAPPHLAVVVGDVNSTAAASLAAVKLGIRVAHLEAGLRSFDRTMPEEINRIITDSIADLLWTSSSDGDENLRREGIAEEKIERVGNIMIDSLEMLRETIQAQMVCRDMNVPAGKFGLITLHRPSNVDGPASLEKLCTMLGMIAKKIPLLFPIHPRTRKNLEAYNLLSLLNGNGNLHIAEPLNYISFMNLLFNCRFVITDSGGIQEETTYLGKPCLTLRPNTERPVTIREGTNRLCAVENLVDQVAEILENPAINYRVPELWDGQTADRVTNSIGRFLFH